MAWKLRIAGDTSRIVYYSRTFPGEFEELVEWMGLDWIAGILLTQSSLRSKEIMITILS